MAAVLHRTTKSYRPSANTPDFPVVDWIINPDLSAVVGQPTKYWTITGDVVSLISQADRDAVDLAEIEAGKDADAARMDSDPVLKGLIEVVVARSNATGVGQGIPDVTPADIKAAVRSRM